MLTSLDITLLKKPTPPEQQEDHTEQSRQGRWFLGLEKEKIYQDQQGSHHFSMQGSQEPRDTQGRLQTTQLRKAQKEQFLCFPVTEM